MWNPLVGSDESNEVIFLIDIGIDQYNIIYIGETEMEQVNGLP